LQTVREATFDDQDKFPEKIVRELARAIVCRTYAPAVHELCHLAAAAGRADGTGRYEQLFWASGPARARNFYAWFGDADSDGLDVTGSAVTLAYPDKPFTVTYGRMPFLSALLEFLMTALGYTALDETLAPLAAEMPSAGQVSDAANELSRKLYAFLGEHLPAVQEQRKQRGFLAFIAERADGDGAAQAIDDGAVLDYWIEHAGADTEAESNEAAPDARTYRNVFKTAARLLTILRLAEDRHGIEVALPIGTDREAGEVDPAELEHAMAAVDEDADAVDALEQVALAGVKLVNKREAEALRQALPGDAIARALTRSVLRNAVFGDAQARLTQALRQGLEPAEVARKIDAEPDDDYPGRLDAFRAVADHLERMLLVSFHVLFHCRHAAAVEAALLAHPDLDLEGLRPDPDAPDATDGSNVVSMQAERALRRFFDDGDDESPLGQLRRDAAKAAKSIARQGFKEADWQDPEIVGAFADGVGALAAARRDLARLLDRHAAGIDWPGLQREDTPTFRAQFKRLYGDRDGDRYG